MSDDTVISEIEEFASDLESDITNTIISPALICACPGYTQRKAIKWLEQFQYHSKMIN